MFIDHLVLEVSTASATHKTCPESHAPFAAVAVVNDGRAFIGTPLLHFGVPDADLSTLGALGVGVDALRLDLVPLDGLDNRQFLAEGGGEIGGLRPCGHGFPGTICSGHQSAFLLGQRTATPSADQPLFSAPQQSQCRMFFSVPLDAGRRLPQSVQKMRDPIAAIVSSGVFCVACARIKTREDRCRRRGLVMVVTDSEIFNQLRQQL